MNRNKFSKTCNQDILTFIHIFINSKRSEGFVKFKYGKDTCIQSNKQKQQKTRDSFFEAASYVIARFLNIFLKASTL